MALTKTQNNIGKTKNIVSQYTKPKKPMSSQAFYKFLMKGMKRDIEDLTADCKLTTDKQEIKEGNGFSVDIDLNILLKKYMNNVQSHFFRNKIISLHKNMDEEDMAFKLLVKHIKEEAVFCNFKIDFEELLLMVLRVEKESFFMLARAWNLNLSNKSLELQSIESLSSYIEFIKCDVAEINNPSKANILKNVINYLWNTKKIKASIYG